MAAIDENTPPSMALQPHARNRRRNSSLFQLEGASLFVAVDDSNLPSTPKAFLSSTPPQSIDPVASSLPAADGGQQHEVRQSAPAADAAVSDADATASAAAKASAAAANSFEIWNSAPTNFPRPTFFFSGTASPPPCPLPPSPVAHSLCSRQPLRSGSFPRHIHVTTASGSSFRDDHCSDHSHACVFLAGRGKLTVPSLLHVHTPFCSCPFSCIPPSLLARLQASNVFTIALHSVFGPSLASFICLSLPYQWRFVRYIHSYTFPIIICTTAPSSHRRPSSCIVPYLPDMTARSTSSDAAAAAAASAAEVAAGERRSSRQARRWTFGGSLGHALGSP